MVTEFTDHICVTMDAELIMFLHDLVSAYLKEKEKGVLHIFIFSFYFLPCKLPEYLLYLFFLLFPFIYFGFVGDEAHHGIHVEIRIAYRSQFSPPAMVFVKIKFRPALVASVCPSMALFL